MDKHQLIRERAYALWEAEGKLDGRHSNHWFQAEREFEAGSEEASANMTAEPELIPAGTTQAAIDEGRAEVDSVKSRAAAGSEPVKTTRKKGSRLQQPSGTGIATS